MGREKTKEKQPDSRPFAWPCSTFGSTSNTFGGRVISPKRYLYSTRRLIRNVRKRWWRVGIELRKDGKQVTSARTLRPPLLFVWENRIRMKGRRWKKKEEEQPGYARHITIMTATWSPSIWCFQYNIRCNSFVNQKKKEIPLKPSSFSGSVYGDLLSLHHTLTIQSKYFRMRGNLWCYFFPLLFFYGSLNFSVNSPKYTPVSRYIASPMV